MVRHVPKLLGAKRCMIRLARQTKSGRRRSVGDVEHGGAIPL
ncbi:hypothetical protein LF41_2914 [Lysobacter dokdonensis DS-58]|uniref:Uncharacterized protein n=1 Tax=Lysobacter dokdonensis DS-58 TaxID=1300345 RepID=A0A0A2WHJ0_9GAMM|nr:hypothetical protein LF41_2914 [Lysobacter dokdonensis DS-58]